mgnify:CR=1 FL=1
MPAKHLAFCFFATLFCSSALAQVDRAKDKTLEYTKTKLLLQFSDSLRVKNLEEKEKALAKAKTQGWKTRIELGEGKVVELIRLDAKGNPVYYIADNADAAISTNTKAVYPGGSLGLSLEGQGMFLGEWDAGAARFTHEQLTGRVLLKDNTPYFDNHSTHVCGTMIGDGTPQSLAKGMAPKATVWSYDWNLDNSEMAAAGANGMLVSNHSYGTVAGWFYDGSWNWYGNPNYNANESYLFGWYDLETRTWDQIAYNAPYYLIVKSAGNDRDDNAPPPGTPHTHLGLGSFTDTHPSDGNSGTGYDCLPTKSNAKNILTVGAVNDIPGGYNGTASVVMAGFSGWGPTDDGRIKPDICGNGINLFSAVATGDDRYATFSGTSMSGPNVAGSCILLQEHYENIHPGNYMRAATLRGLVLHTADEAGAAEGPDYMFGWGMMNTGKAASLISEDANLESHIQENALNNGTTFTHSITINGSQPLVATICWTDVPGAPQSEGHDIPTLNLVNDLDMRIIHAGDTYMPYVLEPAQPSLAATTGDNFRDNVEKIFLANPIAGEYLIVVNHKGTLSGGSQPFSLILSGITNSACADPRILSVAQNSGNSATMSWLPGNASVGYTIEYGQAGFLPGSGTSISGSYPAALNIALNNLLADVEYDIYIKETCAEGETNLIGPYRFRITPTITGGSCESFDAFNYCGDNLFACVQNGTCDGAFTSPGWENPFNDNSDWSVADFSTPSENTGPDGDHTSGTGKYLFVEASSCFFQTAFLLSPGYDLNTVENPSLNFWYHMLGSTMGNLSVDIENPIGSGSWTNLWNISGNQGQSWNNANINLQAYANDIVHFRFAGKAGSDFESDIALDDICVSSSCTADACGDENPCTSDTCVNGICISEPLCTDGNSCTIDICNDGVCSQEAIPNCSVCNNTLTTLLTGNTGQNGGMFDVTAVNTIKILSFEGHFKDTSDFKIYYKPGTHVGYEMNTGAWNLLGSATGVLSNGTNTSTPIPIPVNITIPAGETYSFYITITNGRNIRFTVGSFVGNVTAQDANLRVKEGTGNDYPFGFPSQPWKWNGRIHYTCSDLNPCALNYCSNGVCNYTAVECPDDDDPCTLNYGCVNGQCVILQNLCDDENPCTADACVPLTGCTNTNLPFCDLCEYLVCNDNDACTADNCVNEACVFTSITCNDDDFCTSDACNFVTGCVFTQINCSDSNACTNDACDALLGCIHTDLVCDDADVCTADSCSISAGCVFNLKNCNDNNACTTDECVLGNCFHAALNCDDEEICTTDDCDILTGCTNSVMNCNDGNVCTIDACVEGECVHDFCTDNELCTSDACVNDNCVYTSILCNDNELCTIDGCTDGVCEFIPKNCADGNPCTDDVCNAGVCSSSPMNCDDNDLCTIDACVNGTCIYQCNLLPHLAWQRSLGGGANEEANSIVQTNDGGFIVAGYTLSNNGDVTLNKGAEDYWVIRLDAAGNVLWQKTYGGTLTDIATSVIQTNDDNYVVAGYAASKNGNVTGNHGSRDYWIIKIDTDGNLLWQKAFGGSSNDEAYSIRETVDSGFIVAGSTFSNNGDVSGNHGFHDYWVLKLDADGNLQWQKTLGGNLSDVAYSVRETADRNYLVAGYALSTNGDVTGNHGSFDYWVLKLDTVGNILWQKALGGSGSDKANALELTMDGGCVVAGSAASFNGDVTGNHGNLDYWVVKLDAGGGILWQKALGGTAADEAFSITNNLDGFIVAGYAASTNGNVTGNHGGNDGWAVNLNASGNIVWQKTLGGSAADKISSLAFASGGGFVFAGNSQSNNFNVSGNQGGTDFWLAKIASCVPVTEVDSFICPGDIPQAAQFDTLISSNGCDSILAIHYSVIICRDENPCTIDSCHNGQCIYAPVTCDDNDACTTNSCDEGVCVFTPMICDDEDLCTNDACADGACTFVPVFCDDEDLCTADKCLSGECIYLEIICNDESSCTTDGCENGECTFSDYSCDDSDLCTSDACDGAGGCNYTPVLCTVIISGKIQTAATTPVAIPGVRVILSGDANNTVITTANGLYSFTVNVGGNYTITPAKNNDVVTNNGVTTVDISLIRRHVLASPRLDSPYKIIAADANNSGTVSTADIPPTRVVVLSNTAKFPPSNSRLWEFVNSDHDFGNPPFNPFPFPRTRTYTNITTDQPDQNFIGVKVGDVNNSWNAGTQ